MHHTILSALLFVMMAVTGFAYQASSEKDWYTKSARLLLKGGTTALAGLFALYTYLVYGQTYMLLMALGIFLCAAADVLLEIKFIWGTACFAAGHLLYIASFLTRSKPGLPSLVLLIVLALFATFITRRYGHQAGMDIRPYYAYALIISLMVASALAQPIPVFIGALLFMVSDAIIARRLLNPDKDPWDRACILLYYLAQFTLAVTLLL